MRFRKIEKLFKKCLWRPFETSIAWFDRSRWVTVEVIKNWQKSQRRKLFRITTKLSILISTGRYHFYPIDLCGTLIAMALWGLEVHETYLFRRNSWLTTFGGCWTLLDRFQSLMVIPNSLFLRFFGNYFCHFNLNFQCFSVDSDWMDIRNRIYSSRSIDTCNRNLEQTSITFLFEQLFDFSKTLFWFHISFRHFLELSFQSNTIII